MRDGITVTYRYRYMFGETGSDWTGDNTVDLPGWCAGDVQMCVALYLFGNRDYADEIRIVDWQPRD